MTSRLCTYLGSSIGKKQIMGVTGLLLCGFLVSHLIGNCLIYLGPEAFNRYAHTLVSNPLIYVAEAILAAIFLTHIGLAVKLTIENKMARPERYHAFKMSGHGATLASRSMPVTGLIILAFLISHLLHFKFGPVYEGVYGGVEMRDLYRTVVEYFASPVAVAWYLFCMVALGLHVSHGFWSAFQSIGLNHPKYMPTIKLFSKVFAVVVAGGFAALPIYCYLLNVR